MAPIEISTETLFIDDTQLYDAYYFATNTRPTRVNVPLKTASKNKPEKVATSKAHLQNLHAELEKRDRRRR